MTDQEKRRLIDVAHTLLRAQGYLMDAYIRGTLDEDVKADLRAAAFALHGYDRHHAEWLARLGGLSQKP